MSIWADENQRNIDNADLFEAILREAFGGVTKVAAAHHLFFQCGGGAPEEIPSADALIFSHTIARKIWGVQWAVILAKLALEPVATRDVLLRKLYAERAP